MGTLRFLLAFAVVISHTRPLYGYVGIGGTPAVIAFFVISGFYMHLVLDTKYEGRTGAFYVNRALRLLPAYWTLLVLMLVLGAVGQNNIDMGYSYNWLTRLFGGDALAILSTIPNILIVGTEFFRQLTLDTITGSLGLHWINTDPQTPPPAENYLAAPQMWSVSNEIAFYLAAPFIARFRCVWLFGVLVLAWLAYDYSASHNHLAWRHILPQYNFLYFIYGMAAYRGLRLTRAAIRHATQRRPRVAETLSRIGRPTLWLLAAVPFGYCVVEATAKLSPSAKAALWLPYAATIPALFVLSEKSSWDRWLGELSYPIYVFHYLFVHQMLQEDYAALIILAQTLAVTMVVVFAVERPVERWRHRVAARTPRRTLTSDYASLPAPPRTKPAARQSG